MKLSERKLRLLDKAAAELQEDLLEASRLEGGQPWFIVIRIALLKFMAALEK